MKMMNLWTESLWGDEGFSAIAVQKDFLPMLSVVMKDTAPPFFYLVGFVWGRLFGFSEVSLRSLTLLLMIGAAIFAGLLVYRIDKSKVNGILTSLLVLTTPFLLPFAFEWRMYALLTFTLTASTYFFVAKRWGFYVGFSLAALYTHHFAVFTLVGQGLWFLLTEFSFRKPKKWLVQLRPFILIALGYSFWLYPMYIQISRVRGSGFWLSVPDFDDLQDLLKKFFSGGVSKEWRNVVFGVSLICLAAKDWKRVWKNWLFVLLIFLSPIIFSYLLSQVITPIFYDRYLLSSAALVPVLLIMGSRRVGVLAGFLLLGLYFWFSLNLFNTPRKRPFRELATYVKAEQKAGDVLINYNGRAHHLWETKYYGIPAPIYVRGAPLPLYVGTALMEESDTISALPSPAGRLGVIGSEPVDMIDLPGFKLLKFERFGELSVSWWEKTK